MDKALIPLIGTINSQKKCESRNQLSFFVGNYGIIIITIGGTENGHQYFRHHIIEKKSAPKCKKNPLGRSFIYISTNSKQDDFLSYEFIMDGSTELC